MSLMILPNVIAMVFSLWAIILLAKAATKVGGLIGKVISLLIGGIFFSVTVHASFELAAEFGLLTARQLMPIMGVLITTGCVFFIMAGTLAVKKFQ